MLSEKSKISATILQPIALPGSSPEARMAQLEERHTQLRTELALVERQMREICLAASVCPLCGGSGMREVRGGLYGELQSQPCPCAGQNLSVRGT